MRRGCARGPAAKGVFYNNKTPVFAHCKYFFLLWPNPSHSGHYTGSLCSISASIRAGRAKKSKFVHLLGEGAPRSSAEKNYNNLLSFARPARRASFIKHTWGGRFHFFPLEGRFRFLRGCFLLLLSWPWRPWYPAL